jgi:LPXTG-site transpeptidase (sortase) family protein
MSSASPAAAKLLTLLGFLLIFFGITVLVRLFFNPVKQEVGYLILKNNADKPGVVPPVNTDFAIQVPAIGASAPIVADVDPRNSAVYQRALTGGVAHAKGTAKPGEDRNIFLFAHSSADLLTASRYNSVFYLMHHLVAGDLISIWFEGSEHRYRVTTKKTVNATEVEYLENTGRTESLTLMTCWPPGTTLRRLIVQAEPVI